VTITATAQPLDAPPSVLVDVAVPADNVMTAVEVWRNDSTGRSLVRKQPAAGFESRSVIDYECPYEVGVSYDWAATYYDPADNATTFSEPFTSWPGSWTGNTANASIAANRVTLAGSTSVTRTLTRTLSVGWDEITVAFLDGDGESRDVNELRFSFSTGSIRLVEYGGFLCITPPLVFGVGEPEPSNMTNVPATQPFTIRRTADGFSVAGSVSGSASRVVTLGETLTTITIGNASNTPATSTIVGAITVATFATTATLAEESSAVTLSPASGWIVAPQAPALSIEITDTFETELAQVVSIGTVRNADAKTYHRVLGAGRPVISAPGPQGADEFELIVYTHNRAQELALVALAEPQVPVLIMFPPSLGYDIAPGFYAIGDLNRTRLLQIPNDEGRYVTLPLIAVEPPDVDVENAGWSWAAVATTYPTWAAVKAAYATWADLAVDNRTGG